MGLTFVQFSYVSLETRRLLFSPITSMVESGWRYPNLKPLRPLHWCSCWLWAGYNLCPAEIRCWRFEYLRLMEATDHPSALYTSHGIRANRRVNKLHIHLWEWRPNKMSVVRKFLADMGDKKTVWTVVGEEWTDRSTPPRRTSDEPLFLALYARDATY